jgi:hypothetical protein
MVEKLAHNALVNVLADTHEQDVSWLHVNIGLSCCMFHKALRRKQARNQLAIAIERYIHSLEVPVP